MTSWKLETPRNGDIQMGGVRDDSLVKLDKTCEWLTASSIFILTKKRNEYECWRIINIHPHSPTCLLIYSILFLFDVGERW